MALAVSVVRMMLMVATCVIIAMVVLKMFECLLLCLEFAFEDAKAIQTLQESPADVFALLTDDGGYVAETQTSCAHIAGRNWTVSAHSSFSLACIEMYDVVIIILGEVDECIISGWVRCNTPCTRCGAPTSRHALSTRCCLCCYKFDFVVVHSWWW